MRSLLLCCVLLIASAAPVAAEPADGAIYVSSLPNGADIWIDGTFVGESPILISSVTVGHHVISVSKAGFTVQDVGVDVTAGDGPLMEPIRLQSMTTALRQMGTLAVRSDLVGAGVYIDGKPAGKVPMASQQVAAGSHHVELRYHGEVVARDVDVYTDTETAVVMREESSAGPVVIAPVDSYLPANAYTLVGGKLVIRYAGHKVVGHLDRREYAIDDQPRRYEAAPTLVNGRLYLPFSLLQWLVTESKK